MSKRKKMRKGNKGKDYEGGRGEEEEEEEK